MPNAVAQPSTKDLAPGATLSPITFEQIPAFERDDLAAAFEVFRTSCRARLAQGASSPQASLPDLGLSAICRLATVAHIRTSDEARAFFQAHFEPYRVEPDAEAEGRGFFTGYYEPVLEGSWTKSAAFTAPVLARPADLDTDPIVGPDGETYAASRRTPDGGRDVYPAREQIEADAEAHQVLMWLRDPIELFMMQVQGSARIRMPDGQLVRVGYAGRNGHPYTSIGRILVETGAIPIADMSLDRLKSWVRSAGQRMGEAGRNLLHQNRSYVFFQILPELEGGLGPIGAQGVSLTPLRSLAVDKSIWPYGLPIWIDGQIPDENGRDAPFQHLFIAQDTGSAIVGPARGDIYVGSGDAAGDRAGLIRHKADFIVLIPKVGRQP